MLIDIPKDVAQASFDFTYPDTIDLPGYRPTRDGHPLQIQAAADAIAKARRPVLYVGGGIVNADASDELMALAEATKVPVVTTLMAKGAFPDTHPLSLQMPGMHGSKYANWALNRADLLITVGARFDDRVTGKLDAFAPGARVVHMDIDPAEISKNREADVPIVGELKQVLPALTAAYLDLRAQDRIVDKREWRDQVEEWKFKHPFRYRRAGALKPEYVLERFRDLTRGKDVIWVTGVGQHQMWAAQWLQIDKPRRWVTSGGLGTMGFGVPAAIGAKQGLARVHRRQHRRRRLLPDDDAGAGHRRRATTCRSSTPSSTTAGSAWCASGRSCSTTSATPRPTSSARSPTT